MEISESLNLGKKQPELDFVDIDIETDMPLFIDPYFIGCRSDPWCIRASTTIKNYFQTLISLIRNNDARAWDMFANLGEPNETCLGLSREKPQGRGFGPTNAEDMYNALRESRAVQTGLVEDLEDCRIFIPGVDKDKVSDMTTAIIRRQLIEYTQQQAKLNGIVLTSGIASGFFWNSQDGRWEAEHTDMLIINGKRHILVPKGIVSFVHEYTPQKYYNDYVLEFFQNNLRSIRPVLVQYRKNKTPYVTKKKLMGEFPYSKEFLLDFTAEHPDIFEDFKNYSRRLSVYISDSELSVCDIPLLTQSLIEQLQQTPPGNDHATVYHRLIAGIMELIFYPELQYPHIEREINEGRKRIDITFDNTSSHGFFYDVREVHKIYSPYVLVECKNYQRDISNPELDQMIGRFGDDRSRFGLIVCRQIDDMDLFLKRCRDSLRDGHGLIIPLVDSDFISILGDIAATIQGQEIASNMVNDILGDRCRQIKLA